jgi:hypothetical protein
MKYKNFFLIGLVLFVCLISFCFISVYGICKSDHYKAFSEDTNKSDIKSEELKNIYITTKIPVKTDAQIDFVNSHYDYVMTSALNTELREKIQGPKLLLYRSIQGTWTDFNQFDWAHINANENMFCHNMSQENPHSHNRILTIWSSWLMDGSDIVDKNASDALNHWINYYAVTASEQVYEYNYDGLFVDSAGHNLWTGAVYNLMPDDYSDKNWRDGRYRALEFIKYYFPDKIVVFNGLHSGNGAEHSLELTDGGMWETFAFRPSDSEYFGEEKWRRVIELIERNRENKLITLVSKKEHLTEDIQSRVFIIASYLLISNQNVSINMIDLDYDQNSTIYYFPEYEIYLGSPLNNYSIDNNGIYEKRFEKGIVLVNPGDTESYTYILDRKYEKVVPIGGGKLQENGLCEGFLTYEPVNIEVFLPPISGVILFEKTEYKHVTPGR